METFKKWLAVNEGLFSGVKRMLDPIGSLIEKARSGRPLEPAEISKLPKAFERLDDQNKMTVLRQLVQAHGLDPLAPVLRDILHTIPTTTLHLFYSDPVMQDIIRRYTEREGWAHDPAQSARGRFASLYPKGTI